MEVVDYKSAHKQVLSTVARTGDFSDWAVEEGAYLLREARTTQGMLSLGRKRLFFKGGFTLKEPTGGLLYRHLPGFLDFRESRELLKALPKSEGMYGRHQGLYFESSTLGVSDSLKMVSDSGLIH